MSDVSVTMKLVGWEDLRKKLRSMRGPFLNEMDAAFTAEAAALLTSANALAPKASGTLVSSSTTAKERKGDFVRVAVGYLDEKAPAVHEGIHWGRKSKHVGGRKWLERALTAFEPGFSERIAARLRRLVGGK